MRHGLLLSLVLGTACSQAPEIPRPDDLGTAEPAVVRAIEDAWAEVEGAPRSAEAWGRLGLRYDLHRFDAAAVPCYEQAERLAPRNGRWPYFRGLTLRRADIAAARAAFRRTVELEPGFATAWFYLGEGSLLAEDLPEAQAAFVRCLEADPALLNCRLGLARIALARGEADDAIAPLFDLARAQPEEAAVFEHLARALRATGDPRAAEAESRAARCRNPSTLGGYAALPDPVRTEATLREGASAGLARQRAATLVSQGRFADAARTYREILDRGPDSAGLRSELASALARDGRLDEAIVELERALELAPRDAAARSSLGALRLRRGEIDGAVADLRRAVRDAPGSPGPRANLLGAARRLHATGNAAAALAALDDSEGPSLGDEALRQRAWWLATAPEPSVRDPGLALTLARRLPEEGEGDNPLHLDTLAAALAAAERYPEAAALAERARELVERARQAEPAESPRRPSLAAFEQALRDRAARYRSGAPYREGS